MAKDKWYNQMGQVGTSFSVIVDWVHRSWDPSYAKMRTFMSYCGGNRNVFNKDLSQNCSGRSQPFPRRVLEQKVVCTWMGGLVRGGVTHRVTIESEVRLIYFDAWSKNSPRQIPAGQGRSRNDALRHCRYALKKKWLVAQASSISARLFFLLLLLYCHTASPPITARMHTGGMQ